MSKFKVGDVVGLVRERYRTDREYKIRDIIRTGRYKNVYDVHMGGLASEIFSENEIKLIRRPEQNELTALRKFREDAIAKYPDFNDAPVDEVVVVARKICDEVRGYKNYYETGFHDDEPELQYAISEITRLIDAAKG